MRDNETQTGSKTMQKYRIGNEIINSPKKLYVTKDGTFVHKTRIGFEPVSPSLSFKLSMAKLEAASEGLSTEPVRLVRKKR